MYLLLQIHHSTEKNTIETNDDSITLRSEIKQKLKHGIFDVWDTVAVQPFQI